MISSSNSFHKTHYEILGVKKDANLEEVRKPYRSAILCFHPDKQQNASETSHSECLTDNNYWRYREPGKPCGDYYFIDSFELADRSCSKSRDGDTVSLLTSKSLPTSPCGSCSLKVRLLINGDTRLRRDVHL
ncbi:chaperone protein DnaJ-like [Capsicum chacoense]